MAGKSKLGAGAKVAQSVTLTDENLTKALRDSLDKEMRVVRTEDILAERGKRYGAFADHARIAQKLSYAFFNHSRLIHGVSVTNYYSDSAKEALNLIFNKLGRIANGDADYIDNWDDIAGYAKLQADILRKEEANLLSLQQKGKD